MQAAHESSESGHVAATGGYRWTAISETGGRSRNEDRWSQRRSEGGLALWVVADGMGGHDDGDVAAQIAVNAFLDAAAAQDDVEQAVRSGIAAARKAVGALHGKGQKASAPSSTLVGMALKGSSGFVGHVGDSPLYQFRMGKLVHRTRDHNIRELKRTVSGMAALPQALDPDASQLTRSLGDPLGDGAEDVFSSLELRTGDLILLCSDGISQHIPEDAPDKWAAMIKDEAQLIERARQAVADANLPRQDNYTAVAVVVEDTGTRVTPSVRTWLVFAVAAFAFSGLTLAGISSLGGRQESLTKAEVADKTAPLKKGAPTTAVAGPVLGSRMAPATAAPSGPVTVTRSRSVTLSPAKPMRIVIEEPGETCRQREVPEQQCTQVKKVRSVCDPRSSLIFKEGGLARIGGSEDEAKSSCEIQAETAVTQACIGKVEIQELSCRCNPDEDFRLGVYCSFSVQAECKFADQPCNDVKIVEKECKTVLVDKLVCERR